MIRGILAAIGKFFSCQWNQYTPFGQFLWVLALIAIAVDAGIAWEYGSSMSFLHAMGFALVAVAFAILPDVASMEWSRGKKQAAVWIGLACVPLSMVAYQSHIGYGSAIRVGDIQQTGVHNAKFDDARASLESDRANLTMWREHLAKLQAENAWVATVSPDGLKAKIANMEGDRVYRRSKQCANVTIPESRKFCDDLAELRDRVALATQANDLTARIEATQRLIDGKTEKVASSTFQSSTAVNQTDVFAKLANFVSGGVNADALNVSDAQREVTNTAIMGAASLAFLILAPILNFAAGRNRKPGVIHAMFHGEPEAPVAMTEDRRKIEAVYAQIDPDPKPDQPRATPGPSYPAPVQTIIREAQPAVHMVERIIERGDDAARSLAEMIRDAKRRHRPA